MAQNCSVSYCTKKVFDGSYVKDAIVVTWPSMPRFRAALPRSSRATAILELGVLIVSCFCLWYCIFSPQRSPQIATCVTAEVAIYCTETSVHRLKAKLKSFVRASRIFHSGYLKFRHPSK